MGTGERKLGEFQRVELREAWPNEASDLTPWLARNPESLADALGLGDLEVEDTEKSVGSYRADLVLAGVEGTVVVENQLDHTDHDHLGKLITYGAGEKARTVVWIAKRFRDEHRAALDWLNEISEDTDFFGVELELWRIDDSKPAVRMNVVAKPNDWSREAVRTRRANSQSPTKETQLRYWTAFREVLRSAQGPAQPTKPLPQHWHNVSIGRTGFKLVGDTNSQTPWIRAALYLDDTALKERDPSCSANAYFAALARDREAFEGKLPFDLEWEELPGKGSCRVATYRKCDPTDESDWPRQHEWLADRLNRMHRVLASRIKILEPLEGDTAESTDPDPPSSQAPRPRRPAAPSPA